MPILARRSLNGIPMGIITQGSLASSFTISLARSSGPADTSVSMMVTPFGGIWPNGQTIIPVASGINGSFDKASLIGVGSAALIFTFLPTSSAIGSGFLSVNSSGMTNKSGPQAYSINSSVKALRANRYDIVIGASATAIGSPIQVTIYPNAEAPSGEVVLTSKNGSFSPNSKIILKPGSKLPSTLTYTPTSDGEHNITGTNTAGLYNPFPAPLNVFSKTLGTPRVIALSLARSDMVTFQRDAPSGNPADFAMDWVKGWGEVSFNLTAISGPTNGLWLRLYDAMSPTASTRVGTGKALHNAPVQIYGGTTAAGSIRMLLPAGPYIYYADVATDAAFTTPVRVPQRFRVGVVIGHLSRSQESGLSRSYAYSGNTVLPTNYGKTATWVGYDYRYPDLDSGWFLHDGSSVDPYQYHYGEASSSGAQEIGRLLENQLGVCVGIAGISAAGGGLDTMVNHDGSLTGGFTGSVAAAVGNKFRYLWIGTGGWDGIDGTNFPVETLGENRTRYFSAVDWIARTYSACALIGWVTSASGVFGSDGSSSTGYTRNQMVLLDEIESTNPMVVSKECYSWNEFFNGHATMAARVQYVRAGFRLIMSAELISFGGLQTNDRGPRLDIRGVIKSGSRNISIAYFSPSNSSLQAVGVTCTNPKFTVNTATDTELASLFSVYVGSGYKGNGAPIKIDKVSFNTAGRTVELTLAGTAGIIFADGSVAAMPSSFNVHFAADFSASNNAVPLGSGRAVMITDDRVDDVNGIPHGWHMRPALDIAISTV